MFLNPIRLRGRGPVGPPLSRSIANVLWMGISSSTHDGFLSWRYWYYLQKSDISFVFNFLKTFPFFKKIGPLFIHLFIRILQNQKHDGESNSGLIGDRQIPLDHCVTAMKKGKNCKCDTKRGVLQDQGGPTAPPPESQAYKIYVGSNRAIHQEGYFN